MRAEEFISFHFCSRLKCKSGWSSKVVNELVCSLRRTRKLLRLLHLRTAPRCSTYHSLREIFRDAKEIAASSSSFCLLLSLPYVCQWGTVAWAPKQRTTSYCLFEEACIHPTKHAVIQTVSNFTHWTFKALLMLLRRGVATSLMPSLGIQSSALIERVALQFTGEPLEGHGRVLVWLEGVSCQILWFSSGRTVNNCSLFWRCWTPNAISAEVVCPITEPV